MNIKSSEKLEKSGISQSSSSGVVMRTITMNFSMKKSYKCDICGKSLSSLQTLSNHRMMHPKKQQQLEDSKICDKVGSPVLVDTAITKEDIGTRTKSQTYELYNKQLYKQTECNTKAKIIIGKKSFECEFCNESFPTLPDLTDHKWIHAKDEKPKCGGDGIYNASLLSQLDQDRTERDGDTDGSVQNAIEKVVDNKIFLDLNSITGYGGQNSTPKEYSYECEICSKQFTRRPYLMRHRKIHTGKKKFKCDVCNKAFVFSFNLTVHKRIHASNELLNCAICGATFSRGSDLYNHKRIHKNEKPVSCEICKRQFARQAHLNIHRRVHTGEKPYECDICQRSFAVRSSLVRHTKRHGDKPYDCEICFSSFTDWPSLTKHKEVHCQGKPFSCEICKTTFSTHANLRTHQRIHTDEKPYNCSICSKSFHAHSGLRNHLKSHRSTNRRKCDTCDAAFSHQRSLAYHLWSHSGEKPYKCEVCDQLFSQKCNYTNHMKTHTNE